MLSPGELAEWVAALRAGGVVACATETFFGLLADALDPDAVARVCALKQRDPQQPIAVLLPDLAALSHVSHALPEQARLLAERHWPGPLTLLVPALPGLPAALSKDGKIGVRVPGESPALSLVRAFGGPLTATSANLTGQPAARTLAEVDAAFPHGLAGRVPLPAPGELASTIVDTTGPALRIVRAGPVVLDAP